MDPAVSSPALSREDAVAWIDRWDRQQEGYVFDRERTFRLMFEVVERLVGQPARLLDLASGPGPVAVRALERFPAAEVVALDIDPVLVELGRRAHGDRIVWAEADLLTPEWVDALGGRRFDAVVSATSLHYLDAEHLPVVARGVADLLVPGGVFVDCDIMLTDPDQPRLAALADALRREQWDSAFDGREDFAAWWASLRGQPGFDDLFAERARRFGPRGHGDETAVTERVGALRAAGFAEIATVAQDVDKHVLVALTAES
ncbi:MAG: class I SAM-dependent methyltransferase [Acidimicrobiales bacterium]